MDDKGHQGTPPGEGRAGGVYDREIDLRSIWIFAGSLVGVTLAALALMWWMNVFFLHQEEASDPTPSPISEAALDPIPPGPRLQAIPPRDMDELRRDDRERLTGYGWVDQSKGVARIPIDRAIAILAEKGLPRPSAEAPALPASSAMPPSEPASAAHPAHGKGAHPKKGAK